MTKTDAGVGPKKNFMHRFLDFVEVAGNKLPDPAILFLILMFVTWGLSALLAPVAFSEVHPVDWGAHSDHQSAHRRFSRWLPGEHGEEPSPGSTRWEWSWWRCWESGWPSTPGLSTLV